MWYGVMGGLVVGVGWFSGMGEELFRLGKYMAEPQGEGIRNYILSFGAWGPVVIIGLLIFQAVVPPVPAAVVVLAAMWVYGPLWGGAYAFAGGLLGAMAAYWLGGRLGRGILKKWLGEKNLHWTEEIFRRYGLYAVLFAKLTPLFSVDAISYGAGAASMPFGRFCLAVAVGQTPALLAFAFMGRNADNILELMAYCTLLGVGMAGGFYLWRIRAGLQKKFIKIAGEKKSENPMGKFQEN